MKKTISIIALVLVVLLGFAQNKSKQMTLPPSFMHKTSNEVIDHIKVYPPSAEMIAAEDAEDEKNGTFLKIARLLPVNTTIKNSGTWETLDNGQLIWRLRFSSERAKASALYFDKFDIPAGASVYVYSSDRKIIDGPYSRSDNPDGEEYMIGNIISNDITIEYVAPKNKSIDGIVSCDNTTPIINIGEYGYVYRDEGGFERGVRAEFGSSQSCEVNVNCSVGNAWRIQQRGVARIYVREGFDAGYCTGTLINNTSNDGTPYFLTANHCGPNATTANFGQWKFRFNYEASGCTNPTSESSINYTDVTGCTKVAEGSNNGGSDFYLIKLKNFTTEKAISVNAIYNGWDRSTTAPTGGGAGIHHPAGDIKKISFFTSTPSTETYYGGSSMTGASNAHWKINWVNSGDKTGVTEGGSSGSPIFNSAGRVFGTLSGGSATCSASSLYRYDLYGKMSFHWDNSANGTTDAYKLKHWLDPNNTGATTCNYLDPSNAAPPVESNFSYDFESCTAWAVDNFSPCSTWDGDGFPTCGITNVSFTNSGYTGSYIAFQNGTVDGFTAHGGTKFGCCMSAGSNGANNDWFITPAVIIGNATTFSFWARSANDRYGLEQFKVGISSDDENYTLIDSNGNSSSTNSSAPVEWTQFSYNLSQYAGQTMYLAIICVSEDVFAFFIDDISITGIQSAPSESTENVHIYPNPAKDIVSISLPVDNAQIDIVNILGQIVKSVNTTSANETISLEGMERGMYFFSIKMQDKTITKKVIVE
ncbi:MAG: T9SS type A sorting domain-containing protein [Bacteroidales bacterium]|nr:T9SS type A sorting domain-containing protein [Bacteroidales bacterium]